MNYTMLGTVHKINLKKTNIIDIGDLKSYIIKSNNNKYYFENLKITYNDNNKNTVISDDSDPLNENIFYNVSVVPISCNK